MRLATETTAELTTFVLNFLEANIPTIPGMKNWSRYQEAFACIREELAEHPSNAFSFSFSWDRSFGVGCNLTVRVEYPFRASVEKPGSHSFKGTVSLNWAGTDRSPVEARAAVALYAAVTDLACQLEVHFAALSKSLYID